MSKIVSYIGVATLTVTLVPQVYTTYKTRQVSGLSLVYICLQIISNCCFILYAIEYKLLPILICNSTVLCLSMLLFIAKLKYSRGSEENEGYTPITEAV